ncbi:MAG: ABC transporter permease [Myxococcota bacterium]|nr:ABC transporter permease [Myxococcota bacterium]
MRPCVSFFATLVGAIFLAQLLLWLAPGDAADIVANDPKLREALVQEWGLDQSPLQRTLIFLGHAIQGDLGTSLTYRPGASVTGLVLPASIRSLGLLLGALLVSLVTGVGIAFHTAGRKSWLRRMIQIGSVVPVFLLAYASMTLLNEWTFSLMQAEVISRPGWFALPDQDSFLKTCLAILVLGVGSSALTEIHVASEQELQRIRRSKFIDAARARGANTTPHLFWNLLGPLTTLASNRAAFFLGGLIIIEKVLHVNGVGAMLWQACRLRDYPLALGITFVAAALVCAARLAGDIVRVTVDPRLRAQR